MPGFSPTVGDELAFSSSMDKNGRPQACRLVLLPKGTIRRETQHSAVFRGVLEQEPVLVQSQQSQHG